LVRYRCDDPERPSERPPERLPDPWHTSPMVDTASSTSSEGTASPTERIVVGVDGSDTSKEALAWAIRQARLTGAKLVALTAWSYPAGFGWTPGFPDGFDPEADAKQVLEGVISEQTGAATDLVIEQVVVESHAAKALVEASNEASLLVVGSRGHGGFTGMLLGSVSGYCAAHARCPVVVVHPRNS
jgi:nucleotide-binding universal stress UspA family protein